MRLPLLKTALLKTALLTTALTCAGTLALAAGSESQTPPTNAQSCTGGKIWDQASQSCKNPQESRFNDDQRFEAARALAFAGHYQDALTILATADAPEAPRILNYPGFALRKSGETQAAMTYYRRAFAADPDYNLARSYMGQALIDQGKPEAAKAQLAEIRARGGRDTWAYASLKHALQGKSGY